MNRIVPFEKTNKLMDSCFLPGCDIIVHEGGTSSSKTYSILQALLVIACSEPNRVITVVGQDIPNLKRGSHRQIREIIQESTYIQSVFTGENKSDRIFEFKTGSIIEFNSYQDAQDAKNGKRHYLFANEANGIPYEVFEELNVRTEVRTFLDFNPTFRFWAHDRLMGNPSVKWIRSNFRHNAFISETVKKKILGYEPTPENIALGTANEYRWRVYGLGQVGRLEGLVYPDYKVSHSFPLPTEGKHYYGLDFGYTNDPTVLMEVVLYDGRIYVRELFWETGMSNRDIYNKLKEIGWNFSNVIAADSAEPKSIAELSRMGVRIVGAKKGHDSVRLGLTEIGSYPIFVYAGSKNSLEEFGSYMWVKTRDGIYLNVPIDKFNHGMDAIRYAWDTRVTQISHNTLGELVGINSFSGRSMI